MELKGKITEMMAVTEVFGGAVLTLTFFFCHCASLWVVRWFGRRRYRMEVRREEDRDVGAMEVDGEVKTEMKGKAIIG